MGALGKLLIAQLVERAQDASKRSDSAARAAESVSMAEMVEGLPKSDDPAVKEYLDGVNSPFAGMMSNLVSGDGSQAKGLMGMLSGMLGDRTVYGQMGATRFRMGAEPDRAAAQPPATEADLAATETALGFALPAGLREFYLEVANGGVGPGAGIFSLDDLVAKHKELTREPVGPQGQDWPTHLLPIEGDRWDLTCIDRDTGMLVFWDLEDLDDEDDDPGNIAWAASFKPVADSLEAWLSQWCQAN